MSTPLVPHFKMRMNHVHHDDNEREYMKQIPCTNIVRSLMYGMIYTRLDLAYSISILSRFMSNPGKSHWGDLKWVLRYVNGTLN